MRFQITRNDLARINLVGTSSSGKSTLGKELAAQLEAPYIEMDALYHGPNWTEPDQETFRQRLERAIAGPKWVLDGNYHSKTHDIKWANATLVIWLDIGFPLNMYRAICRAVERSWTRKELWPGTGNRESFRQTFFSKDSMILWTAMSHGRLRKRYSLIEASPPRNLKFVRLKGHQDVVRFSDFTKRLLA